MTDSFVKSIKIFYLSVLPEKFSRKEAVEIYGKKIFIQPRTTDKYLKFLVDQKLLFRLNGVYIKPKDWRAKVTPYKK